MSEEETYLQRQPNCTYQSSWDFRAHDGAYLAAWRTGYVSTGYNP